MIRYDTQTGEPIYDPPAPKEREVYSVSEILFAWLSLAAGYVFCRVFPVVLHPFGGFLFIVALLSGTMVFLKCKGASLGVMPITLGCSALLIAPALFLSANALFHMLVYNYALAVWLYVMYGANEGTLEKGFSDLVIVDFFKALFILPFVSLGKMIPALFAGKGRGRGVALKVLLGLAIAILPTAVVLSLLSYDKGFTDLFGKLFDFDWGDLFSHLFSLILGIPLGMYYYGVFFSSARKKCADKLTAMQCREASAKVRLLPVLTALVATIPLLVVYGVFFASQWGYYTSAFTGVLPGSITYAEYARSGFFQLCAVSVIDLVLIALMQLFVRRSGEKPTVVTRVLSLIFSVATLILMVTAFSKLYLYVKQFGLTPKRLYAGWFMVILAVIFLLVMLKQFLQRFKLLPSAALVSVGLFALLALSGSDTLIAEYNVNRYLNGTLNTIDVSAMQDLGDAAIPSMVRLGKKLAEKQGTDLADFRRDQYDGLYNEVAVYLYDEAEARSPLTFFSYTLPGARAVKALDSADIRWDALDYDVYMVQNEG